MVCVTSQPVVVDGISKKGPNGDWSVYVTEVRFFNAVHHRAISLGMGRSVKKIPGAAPFAVGYHPWVHCFTVSTEGF